MMTNPPLVAQTTLAIAIAMAPGVALAQTTPVSSAAPPIATATQHVPCDKKPRNVRRLSGFHLYEENDSLIAGDDRYTQGLRASFTFDAQALPCFVQKAGRWKKVPGGADGFEPAFAVFLGQGLYTPNIITTTSPERNDRGFTNFDYVGAELSLVAGRGTRSPIRHTLEVSVGALGTESLAFATQGGLHALKLNRIPKGWHTTQPNTFGGYLRYRFDAQARFITPGAWTPDVDVTGGPAVELGNIRTGLALHTTTRFGWNLTGFPSNVITAAADPGEVRRSIEFGGMLGFEARAIGMTTLVQVTPGSDTRDLKNFVHDLRYGVFGRINALSASYVIVERSSEFAVSGLDAKPQRFGSVTLSYDAALAGEGTPQWLVRDWRAELGMGRNFRGPTTDFGQSAGVTGQVALRKELAYGFDVGGEIVASAVEHAAIPSEPGNRSDIMLRQTVITLGWTKSFKFGVFGVRGGTAARAAARVQTVTHPAIGGRLDEKPDNEDFAAARGGLVIGGQFFPHLQRHVAIGLDVSYHRVRLSEAVPGLVMPRFVKAIILVQLRKP